MKIRNYINHIKTLGFFEGEIEINTAENLYNISITTYNQITEYNYNILGYSFIHHYYNSNDNNENRNLVI